MVSIQETKAYLRQVEEAKKEVLRCDAELEELRLTSRGITTTYSFGGHSGNKVDLSDFMVQVAEEEIKLEQVKLHWLKKRIEVKHFIESLPFSDKQKNLRLLLIYRYITNKSFAEIASILNYSYDHVTHYMHPQALKVAAKKLTSNNLSKCDNI